MNEFIIRFVGIILFMTTPIDGTKDAQHVVVPAFKNAGVWVNKQIPQHMAYIAFTTDTCGPGIPCADTSEWGTPKERQNAGMKWNYFDLDGYHLEIETTSPNLSIESSFRDRVPRIKAYCSQFDVPEALLDDTTADVRKAATIDITNGILSAIGDVSANQAVISKLTVTSGNTLVITATRHGDASQKKTLVLRTGTLIQIGNEPPDLFLRGEDHTEHEHFLIYYWMAKSNDCTAKPGRFHRLPPPDAGPAADCSNSGYP